jgi:lactoylglutathione lyase
MKWSAPEYPIDVLLSDLVKEGHRTDSILRSMPAPFFDYFPGTNLRPVRELVRHVASVYLYVAAALGEDRWDATIFDVDLPLDDLRTAVSSLARARKAALGAAQACPPERLFATVAPFGFPETAITYLRRAVDHEIHHRGEISVYAALAGHPIGDLYECERGKAPVMAPALPRDFLVTADCHGSGRCVATAPAQFALDIVDGQARIVAQPDTDQEMAACREAERRCPVNAIRSIARGQVADPSRPSPPPSSSSLADVPPIPGLRIDHVNMFVRDLEESVGFYTRLLGLAVKERGVGKGRIRWAIVGHPDRFYLCFYELAGATFEPDALHINHVGIYVVDFDATVRGLRDLGLTLEYGDAPVDWGTSRSAYVRDPNGYSIEFVEKFGGGIG